MSGSDGNAEVSVSVAYATAVENFWRDFRVPAGSSIEAVIDASGVLSEFPAIDLSINKVGVFGKISCLDAVVSDGDRIEIYRPISIDPQLLPKKKYRLRKLAPLIEASGKQETIVEPTHRTQGGQEDDQVSLSGLFSEYGFVVKVDVTDLERSIDWYCDKLGFELDERFSAGSWRQLTMPDLPHTALGLFVNPDGAGLGGKKVTFVVEDIELARNRLVKAGVEVDEIETLGNWVKLAFLRDPDGNVFGIRQSLTGGEVS